MLQEEEEKLAEQGTSNSPTKEGETNDATTAAPTTGQPLVTSAASATSSTWYPGKYIGIKGSNKDKDKDAVSGAKDDTEPSRESEASETRTRSGSSTSSQWFSSFWGGGLAQGQGEACASDIEDSKKESMITATVRKIRARFLSRQLVGRIYIYRLSGVISTAVLSDVTAEDIAQYLIAAANNKNLLEKDELINAELTGNYKRALTTTDTILNSLERRSLAWEGCDFGNNTLLTRGTTLGVSDPIVGLIGFSFTLELSATAHSLLASRKRFEAARELATDLAARDAPAPEAVGRPSLLSYFRGRTSPSVATATEESVRDPEGDAADDLLAKAEAVDDVQ
jgi:hypothetical protein